MPISTSLLKNCTCPVGVPDEDVTRPVNVTDCPLFDGFNDDVTVVVVEPLDALTVCVSDPWLPEKLASPEYVTVIACVPVARPVVSDAAPFCTAAVPSTVDPAENVSVPVGWPAPGAMTPTLAVNVMA